jgi:sugar phosphate isomerase/epimerase
MHSRRAFLTSLATGLGASVTAPVWARGQDEIKTSLNGPLGLQLWSLREYLPKDLRGSLAKVRALGFREVEGAGLWGQSAAEMRAALDGAGLRCQSAHMGFERLRDDLPGALVEAKAVGARWVVCPWIPPKDDAFTRDDALKAAEAFNRFEKAATDAGLRFGYHCHGYDFVPSAEGTLFDTLAGATNPRVMFQIDVFHAFHGGADPAKLIDRYNDRVGSLHLKDLNKKFSVKVGAATAPAEADVPVGSGQIDIPAVLRAAKNGGTKLYYLEDESPDPWGHIPQSVAYLKNLEPPKSASVLG